jgi:hypothetical protein
MNWLQIAAGSIRLSIQDDFMLQLSKEEFDGNLRLQNATSSWVDLPLVCLSASA